MKLFEKGKIGSLELKNRIFMTPMGTAYDPDGGFSKRAINYYAERAKGGTGLIITGSNVCSTKFETPLVNVLDSVHHVDRLAQVADNVHFYGAKLCIQLSPGNGRNSPADPARPPRSASAVSSFWFEDMKCIPFTVDEIHELVGAMGYSAYLAKTAGADAVELHGYGGYLFDQFMSEMWNWRTDEYGGSLENRMRFILECITEIQKTCGKDFPIIVKYTPDHWTTTPGSRKLPEGIEMAKIFEAAGVAALHIDKGCYDVWYEVIPNVYMEDACQAHLAHEIKKVVNIPVMAHGKLGDPLVAESVLEDGKADFIGLGHTSLCEPHWANKVKQGKFHELRPCIGCNECVAGIAVGKDSCCAINPLNGVEKEYPLLPVNGKKRLLIVGGGPAGMQAAITARARGIEVDLWDKGTELGGLLLAAGAPSFKNDVKKFTNYLVGKVYRSGVNVTLNKEATIEDIEKGNYDFVITATGARPVVPPVNGITNSIVKSSTDILTGKVKPGKKNVVIGGGLVGIETALSLISDKNVEATVIEMMPAILSSGEVFLNNALKLYAMIAEAGLQTICSAKVTEVCDDYIKYIVNDEEKTLECDCVILACGYTSNKNLVQTLEEKGIEFKHIGDCVKPGKIYEAVHEGYHAARLLFEEFDY